MSVPVSGMKLNRPFLFEVGKLSPTTFGSFSKWNSHTYKIADLILCIKIYTLIQILKTFIKVYLMNILSVWKIDKKLLII